MSGAELTPEELDRIARSPGWRAQRMEVFDTTLGKVLVKAARPAERHPARYWLLNALARGTGVGLLQAAPLHGGQRGLQTEVARLRALHAAGARVPRVLYVAPDHFVMQWLGNEHLFNLLQARHPDAAALWREAGDALVQLHAHGQYLSQAFARNLLVDTRAQPARLAGAIDFEDDPLEVMDLPDAQARDWLTFWHSSLWLLPQAEAEARVRAWLAQESPAVRERIAQAGRRLGWLRHLPRQRRWGRDTVALQAVAAALHRCAQGGA